MNIVDHAYEGRSDGRISLDLIVADDSFTADAWDTALLVLGPERGYKMAREHGLAALFILREGEGYVTQETPAWQQQFPTASSSSAAGRQRRLP